MCGIFGLIVKEGSTYNFSFFEKTLSAIALLSQSRGKDSSGVVFRREISRSMEVLKGALPIEELIKSHCYKHNLSQMLDIEGKKARPVFAAMGHARLVTNGTQLKDENNQPVFRDEIVTIHNGIVVNVDELWKENAELIRSYEIDTEIINAITRKNLKKGLNSSAAVSGAINKIFGTVAVAMFFSDRAEVILGTNNGSFYTLDNGKDVVIFASEKYFLTKLASVRKLGKIIGPFTISQLESGSGMLINLRTFERSRFKLSDNSFNENLNVSCNFGIHETTIASKKPQKEVILEVSNIHLRPESAKERSLLEFNWDRISHLKRCTKCLLPETFPFISYDEKGVCNYCNNYRLKNQPKPVEKLFELVEPFRSSDGSPDCLIPFSGGRDSTFTLHVAKNILKLNPITFTYDWGMVTDLARRNIARVCGKMGVENIIVSADIHWKRENIRKNILAWLKQPELGMIPLFMAGDKYFFYFTDKVKKQTGLKLNIWGVNPLENTDFKVGFCGIPPQFDKERIYSLSIKRQIQLFRYFGHNLITNPSYFNSSLLDTFGSFLSRYVAPKKDYYHMYDYWRWDQNEIENILFNEYDWETAVDTKTTWRIGDGTAGFYNYLYYTVAGFSEFDTFKSNQIREGMINREEGMRMIELENMPRYNSIKWYLEIIGLDFVSVIKRINQIQKLY